MVAITILSRARGQIAFWASLIGPEGFSLHNGGRPKLRKKASRHRTLNKKHEHIARSRGNWNWQAAPILPFLITKQLGSGPYQPKPKLAFPQKIPCSRKDFFQLWCWKRATYIFWSALFLDWWWLRSEGGRWVMSCKGHHDCDDDQATTLTLRFGGKELNFKIYGCFTFEPLLQK